MINIKAVFWIFVTIAVAIYVIMLAWSLPTLSRFADGLLAFDLRPGGYSFDEARQYISSLGDEGISFYQNVQHRLDMLFPLFEGVSIAWSIWLLTPEKYQNWKIALALVAVPGTIFDYLENASVGLMLRTGSNDLTIAMVETASRWTQLKSIFVSVSLILLLALIGVWIFQRFKRNSI